MMMNLFSARRFRASRDEKVITVRGFHQDGG